MSTVLGDDKWLFGESGFRTKEGERKASSSSLHGSLDLVRRFGSNWKVCVLRVHVPTASKRAFPVQAEERPSPNVVSATRREKYPTSESQIAKRRMGLLFRVLLRFPK